MKDVGKITAAFPVLISAIFALFPIAVQAQASGGSAGAGAAAGGAGAGASGGTVVISGHSQTITQTLKGGNVRITGDANTVTIKGKINSLHVGGDENGVRVEQVKMISTKGDGNLVKWKSSAPKPTPMISNTGEHNTIEKDDGGSLTPPTNPAMDKTNAAKTGP